MFTCSLGYLIMLTVEPHWSVMWLLDMTLNNIIEHYTRQCLCQHEQYVLYLDLQNANYLIKPWNSLVFSIEGKILNSTQNVDMEVAKIKKTGIFVKKFIT